MTFPRLSLLAFILIVVSDFAVRLNSFDGVSNGSALLTLFANIIAAFSFIFLFRKLSLENHIPDVGRTIILCCLGWGVFSFLFGAVRAEEYWGWKSLLMSHLFTILIPLAIIVGIHYELFLKVFRFISFVIFPLGIMIIPYAYVNDIQLVPRMLAPIMLFLLFSLYVPFRWRIFFFVVALISVGIDMSYRTNFIRFLISAGLLGLIVFKIRWHFRIWPLVVGALLSVPLILLILGVTGEFNIFSDNTFSYDVETRKGREVDVVELNVDTRTFLYEEVFNSMIRRNSSFLIGEGGAAGYDTIAFMDSVLNDEGRYSTEVGFLNILLHQGAIGVVLYAAMLVYSCAIAMRYSNNSLCKMIGLFLMTRWVILFMEDWPGFDINNYINWVAMGLCLSNGFRALTDEQLREKLGGALISPFGRS